MNQDVTLDEAEIVLHIPAEARSRRLSSYFRGLARPRAVLVLVALASLPSLGIAAAVPGDPGGLRTFGVVLGAGACLLVVVCGALAAAVQAAPAYTLTVTERGVRAESRGTITEHGWDWIVDFSEERDGLEILVEPPPMRSFQLARPELERLCLTQQNVGDETLAVVRALLRAHVRR